MINLLAQERIDIYSKIIKNAANVGKQHLNGTKSLSGNSDIFDQNSYLSVGRITNEQLLALFPEIKEKKTNQTANGITDFFINNEILINTQSFSTTVRKKPAHTIGRRY